MLPIYRLKNKFYVPNYKILDRITGFGGYRNDKFVGIEYFNIELNSDEFKNIIPVEYQRNFKITLMKVNIDVPPHLDISRSVTINLYVKNSDGILKFFDFKDDPNIVKGPTPENKNNYPKEDLIETISLRVEENNAYLMNVKLPHSVENHNFGDERVAICYQTTEYKFTDVYQMLYSTGNLYE